MGTALLWKYGAPVNSKIQALKTCQPMTVVQNRLVLNITHYTLFKSRPIDPAFLAFHERVATSPQQGYLNTYADWLPNEDLQGHFKVELAEACHGSRVWYILRDHCQIYQGQITSQPPAPASAPLRSTANPASSPSSPSQPANPSATANNATGQINAAGLELIKQCEGLRLEAYICPAGVATIGYGTTRYNASKPVQMGDRITETEAEALLRNDVAQFEQTVRELVKVPLTSNQFSALVCFTYNVGSGAFAESTLLKLLNQRQYAEAAEQLLRWVKGDNGEPLPGLVSRRQAEKKLFLTP